jgi:hypothetical protein
MHTSNEINCTNNTDLVRVQAMCCRQVRHWRAQQLRTWLLLAIGLLCNLCFVVDVSYALMYASNTRSSGDMESASCASQLLDGASDDNRRLLSASISHGDTGEPTSALNTIDHHTSQDSVRDPSERIVSGDDHDDDDENGENSDCQELNGGDRERGECTPVRDDGTEATHDPTRSIPRVHSIQHPPGAAAAAAASAASIPTFDKLGCPPLGQEDATEGATEDEPSVMHVTGMVVAQVVVVIVLVSKVVAISRDIDTAVAKYNATLVTFGLYLSPRTGVLHVAPAHIIQVQGAGALVG